MTLRRSPICSGRLRRGTASPAPRMMRPQPEPQIGGAEAKTELRSPRSLVRQMLHSASATLLLQGFSLLVGFGTSVLLAHLLGGDGYGRYVYALARAACWRSPRSSASTDFWSEASHSTK